MKIPFKYAIAILPLLGIRKERLDFNNPEKYLEMIKHDFSTTDPIQFPIHDWIEFVKANHLLKFDIGLDIFLRYY